MLYLKLYLILLKVALLSFGGAYSIWALLAKEVTVECAGNKSSAWILPSSVSPAPAQAPPFMPVFCRREFNALFAVSEVMPGPQVNAISVFLFRGNGVLAVFVAVFALLTPGFVFAPLLLRFYRRHRESGHLKAFFSGAVLATVSVLLLFFMQLFQGQVKAVDWRSGGIAAVTIAGFAAAYFYKVNPLFVIIAGGLAGFFFF